MTSPSQATYLTLIGSVNGAPPTGSGWSVLINSASSTTNSALYAANGFSATAYVNTQTNQDADDDVRPHGPGYVAHVALDSTRMMIDGQEQTIAPGMAVTAEIKTGRRSVISYLLSPLQRYAHEGIRER